MSLSTKNHRAFKRAVNKLNAVIAECRKEIPGSFVYLDGNSHLHLLDGTKEIGEVGDQDTIIATATLNASGGDW